MLDAGQPAAPPFCEMFNVLLVLFSKTVDFNFLGFLLRKVDGIQSLGCIRPENDTLYECQKTVDTIRFTDMAAASREAGSRKRWRRLKAKKVT